MDSSSLSSILDNSLVASLIKEAKAAKLYAYVPYSRFPVGASVISSSYRIYSGCNVENSSFGLTICAERTAIVKAISEGDLEFLAVMVVTDKDNYIWPCGACRQFLSEFGNIPIISMKNDGSLQMHMLSHLLPFHFSKNDFVQ
ncbi:hypothetical protein GAYE_SCF13G3396 [Galdieria yellowstonensis]|uniref:Cytidine deaminase n=1 Tax=Galdieria yellowstonensis TaxID=3028027 RepID=A0AAV9IDS9_9RHOD|nr:hypothetical protein GAYE_SCF13G3396 [Galdieria yellowstonensis]